jgi:carbonic anhydrase
MEQFHFHSGSEHTINGERFDLEMMSVLSPLKNGTYQYSHTSAVEGAISILFSVDSYTVDFSPRQQSIIDNFFDQLKWEDTSSPTVEKISYSDLMELVDFSNRFVYQGSLTTPPCRTLIYRNVLSTVYPISQKHLDQFK